MKHIKHDFRLKACVRPPGWTKGEWSKGQYSTFSEHGHVAYQIKGNHEFSNMVANTLNRQKVTIQFLHNMVMLHIRLKGITNGAKW